MARKQDETERFEAPPREEPGMQTLTLKAFFSVLAIATYWGLIFSAYWGTSFVPGSIDLGNAGFYCKAAGFIGQAAGMAVLFLLGKRLTTTRGVNALVVVGACLCPLGGLPMLLTQFGIILPLPPVLGMVFLFGCGHACLLCRTGFLLDALIGPLMGISIALALFFSCGIYVVTLLLPEAALYAVLILLPWLCCLFIELARTDRSLRDQDYTGTSIAACSNPSAGTEFRQFFIQVLFYSLVFSLVQLLSVVLEGASPTESADSFWLVILLSASGMFIYSVFVNRYISPKVFLWYMLPLAALGLLPLPFAGPEDRFVCWLLIAFGFTFFDMLSLYSLSSFIKFNNLSIIRYFALGRLSNALGMALGWMAGLALLLNVPLDIRTIGLVTSFLVIALIVLLIFFNRPRLERPDEGRELGDPASADGSEGSGDAPMAETDYGASRP